MAEKIKSNVVDEFDEEEIPQEVLDYEAADTLMESAECAVRFERKVLTLQNAAKKFEALGDYEDAKKKQIQCLKLAEEAEKAGVQKAWEEAEESLKKASTLSDYRVALTEFERIESYRDVQKKKDKCQKVIKKLETLRCWKNRGIAVCILAVMALIFTRTPLYPVAKGVVHQKMGQYQAAINCYKASGGTMGANGKMKKCYYILAQREEKKGHSKKAMKLYYKASDYQDAKQKCLRIETHFLRMAKAGERVFLSGKKWTVLKNANGALLLMGSRNIPCVYDEKEQSVWSASSLRTWMNETYFKFRFRKLERSMIRQNGNANVTGDGTIDAIYELSQEEYEAYGKYIPTSKHAWWLRDGDGSGKASVVNPDGTVQQVSVHEKNMLRPVINFQLQ